MLDIKPLNFNKYFDKTNNKNDKTNNKDNGIVKH